MLPSSTVENYLKALYQAESSRTGKTLVPMGQLATSVGVAPGTATTMVKFISASTTEATIVSRLIVSIGSDTCSS